MRARPSRPRVFLCLWALVGACTPSATEPSGAPQQGVGDGDSNLAGWGAVFHIDGKAYQQGGGRTLVGPGEVGVGSADATGPCQTREVKGGPRHAVLAVAEGLIPEMPPKPPALQASLVEAAAWRIDELLPDADAFTPNTSAPDPARQRGVALGSAVKTRRVGAPPVLIAAGSRDCNGVIAILDAGATTTLASSALPLHQTSCDQLRVLPAADLDGDGAREFAAFNDRTVALYRLVEAPGTVGLTRLGLWACPPETPL